MNILAEELECPVCFQTPRNPPIYQCENGHLICSACKPRLNKCPQGKCELAEQRSLIAERLLERSSLPRPCKNSLLGCLHEEPSFEKLLDHEEQCEMRTVECPDPNCEIHFQEDFGETESNLLYGNVIKHFREHHGIDEIPEKNSGVDTCVWVVDSDDLRPRSIESSWPLSVWQFQDSIYCSMLKKGRREELWYAWIYSMTPKPKDKTGEMAEIKVVNASNNSVKRYVTYKGPVFTLDRPFVGNLKEKSDMMILTDSQVKNFLQKFPKDKQDDPSDDIKYLLHFEYKILSA